MYGNGAAATFLSYFPRNKYLASWLGSKVSFSLLPHGEGGTQGRPGVSSRLNLAADRTHVPIDGNAVLHVAIVASCCAETVTRALAPRRISEALVLAAVLLVTIP